jgi:hypothetical protein
VAVSAQALFALTNEPMRTAKSCGPDSPTLESSLAKQVFRLTTVAIKARTPGRSRISRKTIARGMPVDPAEPVVTAACYFHCRRAMGEAITRHSLRPPICEARTLDAWLGQIMPRERERVSQESVISAKLRRRAPSW